MINVIPAGKFDRIYPHEHDKRLLNISAFIYHCNSRGIKIDKEIFNYYLKKKLVVQRQRDKKYGFWPLDVVIFTQPIFQILWLSVPPWLFEESTRSIEKSIKFQKKFYLTRVKTVRQVIERFYKNLDFYHELMSLHSSWVRSALEECNEKYIELLPVRGHKRSLKAVRRASAGAYKYYCKVLLKKHLQTIKPSLKELLKKHKVKKEEWLNFREEIIIRGKKNDPRQFISNLPDNSKSMPNRRLAEDLYDMSDVMLWAMDVLNVRILYKPKNKRIRVPGLETYQLQSNWAMICAQCGKQFEAKKRNDMTCNTECRMAYGNAQRQLKRSLGLIIT